MRRIIYGLLFLMVTMQLKAQNYPIQPITATRTYLGLAGSATVQIDDANNDGVITRPLIIAEGLDTGFFANAGSIGDNDLATFTTSVNDANSTDLSDLLTGGNLLILGDQDYDLIYVNWDNGTDYLQRNAYVLQRVITWVNQQKALAGSTEPNVVLGQSMGGVIARYALRDMENRGETHDTSLYISHDAPHQGAHVPLGLLYLARHVGNELIETPLGNYNIPINQTGNISVASVDGLLDSPAVKQMLNFNVTSSLQLDNNSTHDTWQNELRLMGYPQQTRNISLSNASHCAETQGLSSNEELLDVSFDGNTSGLTDLIYL
jgi:hypothetical protein